MSKKTNNITIDSAAYRFLETNLLEQQKKTFEEIINRKKRFKPCRIRIRINQEFLVCEEISVWRTSVLAKNAAMRIFERNYTPIIHTPIGTTSPSTSFTSNVSQQFLLAAMFLAFPKPYKDVTYDELKTFRQNIWKEVLEIVPITHEEYIKLI